MIQIPIPSMSLHFRKILSDGDYPCRTDSDSEHCFNPPPHTVPHHRIPTPYIAMLCVLALAFLMLSYLALLRYRNTRRRGLHRQQHPVISAVPESVHEEEVAPQVETEEEVVVREDEDQGLLGDHDHHVWHIRTVGFPQSVINSIAVFRYKRVEGLIEGTDCSVCLNEFEEDETLRLLPKCSHAFHLPCIDTWLRAQKNCPLCRAPIMAPNNGENGPGNSLNGDTSNSTNQPVNEFESGQDTEIEGSRRIMGNGPTIPHQEDVRKIRSNLSSSNGGIRVLSDLGEHRGKINRELARVRRSSSMEILVASTVGEEMGNKEGELDKREGKNLGIYRLIKSASFGRSLQKGPISMKRSFSFSGKRKNRSKHDLYTQYLDA